MKTRNFIFGVVFLVLILAILHAASPFVSIFLPNDSKYWRQEAEKLQKESEKLSADLQEKTEKVSELKDKLSASEKKVKKLSKQLEASKGHSDNEILSLLFPTMEFPYEIRDLTVKFYSHPSCHKKYLIDKKLTFVGYSDQKYEYYDKVVDATFNYYITKTFEKGFVFSKTQPLLFAIK